MRDELDLSNACSTCRPTAAPRQRVGWGSQIPQSALSMSATPLRSLSMLSGVREGTPTHRQPPVGPRAPLRFRPRSRSTQTSSPSSPSYSHRRIKVRARQRQRARARETPSHPCTHMYVRTGSQTPGCIEFRICLLEVLCRPPWRLCCCSICFASRRHCIGVIFGTG